MAINFLNNVDYNQNQLLHARIENQASDALAGTPVDGQLYYNTSAAPGLKVGEAGAWVFVGGGVESITTANSTFVSLADTGTAAVPILTASLSASGTPDATKYLRGDNAWEPISAIPGTYNWTLQGDTGGPNIILSGTGISIVGGQDLETTLSGTTLTVKLTVGPGSVGTNVNYISNQGIALADADDSIPFNSYTPGGNPPSTQVNVVKKTTLGTIPVTALTLVKTYIDESVTGLLQFIGGFDANTGDLDSPLTTNLYTNTALAVGDLYVVSTAGNFFGNAATPLTPGDSVIVQTAAAAGAAVEADFIVVQSDTDLATLTTVGIGNVNAGTGISVAYTAGTATVTNTDTNTSNTTTGTITAGSLSGTATHTWNTKNTIVQTIDDNGDTVFCDITRTTTSATATISVAELTDITILVQRIG